MHSNGDCVKVLAESGTDVNTALLTVAHLGHSVAVDLLIQAGAVVNVWNLSGNTPLILAAQRSDAKSLNVLIKAGADVNYRNSDWERNEYSALEEVIEDYSTSHLSAEKLQCIRLLLKAGNVNSRGLLHISDWQLDLPPDHLAQRLVIPRLLQAAGETSYRRVLNSDDPVTKERQNLRLTLKHIWRETIRNHLMELNSINLFVKVRSLGLPPSLARFLLYNESVSEDLFTKDTQ